MGKPNEKFFTDDRGAERDRLPVFSGANAEPIFYRPNAAEEEEKILKSVIENH